VPSEHQNATVKFTNNPYSTGLLCLGCSLLREEDVELRNLILLITIHFKL